MSDPLIPGLDNIDKIGRVAVLKRKRDRRYSSHADMIMVTGIFHGARDEFRNDELTRTWLMIGNQTFLVDWNNGDTAEIEFRETP